MTATGASDILELLGSACRDSGRRETLRQPFAPNGIDFVEFDPATLTLHVHFIKDLPANTADPYGLHTNPSKILIHGGTRIVGIQVTGADVAPGADKTVLDVKVNMHGDFSPYLLSLGWERMERNWSYSFPAVDRLFSVAPINFRPNCPVDFDCAPVDDCPPEELTEPALDYLARDYASFRQMLIDLVAQRNRSWTERSPADIGMMLIELFAYEGDRQSYFQDAVANEAFLDTARQRVSAKRHARLVDYQMHDGRNAWTYVHLEADSAGKMPQGQQLLTEITVPLRFDRDPSAAARPQPTAPPPTEPYPPTEDDYTTDPALAQVRVFETATSMFVSPLNNELRIHDWGNVECCLPRGTRTAYVYAVTTTAAGGLVAERPPLKVGDLLLLEEVIGPTTGAPSDADPQHRQVVCIERLAPATSEGEVDHTADTVKDDLYLAAVDPQTGTAVPVRQQTTDARLPLVEVTWRKSDALTFPLCVTTKVDGNTTERVSVARGNIVLADHGRSRRELLDDIDPHASGTSTYRIQLDHAPLTIQCQPEREPKDLGLPPVRQRTELDLGVTEQRPGLVLRPAVALRTPGVDWTPVADLLSSDASDRHFVVDVDDLGRGVLRFGDGDYGQRFADVTQAEVWYRVGNGRSGNIGAEALHHIVLPQGTVVGRPVIGRVRNPLPAVDGTDRELIEEVRQYAPAAFRARQLRAVTEQDYKDRALTVSGVSGAVASFRWTGSWYTVFVGIDPTDPANVITNERGVASFDERFRREVEDALTQYRLAGYDLEIRPARYIPLDIVIEICVKPGYFRGDVVRAVSVALSPGSWHAGAAGFFDPERFTFGEPVHLSRLYAAVTNVEGVESARVTKFQRHGRLAAGEIDAGTISLAPWEIARLDNDPNRMENGTLTITAGGGS